MKKTEMQKKNLQEIKDFLCKKNFIKLGCNSPPDVLKKMYESCLLTGNLENTNTTNMVHNYFKSINSPTNHKDKTIITNNINTNLRVTQKYGQLGNNVIK